VLIDLHDFLRVLRVSAVYLLPGFSPLYNFNHKGYTTLLFWLAV